MRLPRPLEKLDRAIMIRHFAITAAAALAYLLRFELRVGNGVLWILGTAAAMNLAAFFSSRRPGFQTLSPSVSPFVAVACWAVLVNSTGGVESPFSAGFWLEIALSAMSLSRILPALVTLASVLALWAQQASIGLAGAVTDLLAGTGFLVLLGGVAFLLTRRSLRTQRDHSRLRSELEGRLGALEKELDDVRLVGEVGENAAQLAHGLKNAVHSMRGFTSLIEPKIRNTEAAGAAFEGLRVAIDRLEDLARLSLRPRARGLFPGATLRAGPEAGETIEDVTHSEDLRPSLGGGLTP